MERENMGLGKALWSGGMSLPLFPPPKDIFRPYDFYATMRRERPVAHDERHGMWAVYRHGDVERVLSDYTTFSSDRRRAVERLYPRDEQPRLRSSLVGSDPPRHRQLRDLVSRAFTPRAVANLEPRIAEITQELLDQVIAAGRMDLIGDLAYPLPVIVIAEMLGIPSSDRARFKRWSDALVGASDETVAEGKAASEGRLALLDEMDEYFRQIVEERRAQPRGDLISGLVQAEIEGKRLSDEETLAFCTLLLVAGNVTTTNLIGNAILCLLDHRDQFERLCSEPAILPSAIEEVLRYESPVQTMMRTATRDVEIGGHTIPAGEMVMAFIGSANRDEAVFPRAEQFDITREPNPHIAFGHGIHFCLGAPLARLEARIALSILLDRLHNLERAEDEPMETAKGLILHGPTRLPLRFAPGQPRGARTAGMPKAA